MKTEVEFYFMSYGKVSIFVDGKSLYECGATDVPDILKDISNSLYERFLNDKVTYHLSRKQLELLIKNVKVKSRK